MTDKVDPKEAKAEAKAEDEEKNAATGFGLEDHEATQQDARVTTIRTDHERRSLMMPSADGRRYNKSTSRIMSVNDQWSIPNSPPEDHESSSDNAQPKTLDLGKSSSKGAQQTQPAYDADSSETDGEKRSSAEPDRVLVPPQRIAPSSGSDMDTEMKVQPPKERPEDLPLPPPIMMPITPRNSRALDPAVSADDVQSSLSKLTNTDVTFHPSKKFATKGTNTSGTMISEGGSDAEEEEDQEDSVPNSFPDSDLRNLFLLACREARSAGEIARAHNEAKQQDPKENEPESRTDSLVESTFINAISSRFPDHIFITGERIAHSETGIVELTDKPTWIIDPIDGAMNFAHHFPYYCMSVAYLVEKQTEFAIIYNPPMKNMYTAERGKGAKMNGKAIKTTHQEKLAAALVLQEFGSAGKESGRMSMKNAQQLSKLVHAMRSIGSPVMGLAMVASGVADAYFNFGLHIWHMAAGVLLVTEAGGVVMDPAGGELDIMSRRCLVASTDQLAKDLVSKLEQTYPTPRDDVSAKPEMHDFTSQTDFPDTESSETDTNNA